MGFAVAMSGLILYRHRRNLRSYVAGLRKDPAGGEQAGDAARVDDPHDPGGERDSAGAPGRVAGDATA